MRAAAWPSGSPGPRNTHINLPGPPFEAICFLRASATLTVVAATGRRGSRTLLAQRPGIAGDGLASGNCAGLFVCCNGHLSARTASGVKSGIAVEGRAFIRNECRGKASGDVRRGLTDGALVGRVCSVADGGGASTDLADGGSGGGWDCPVGGLFGWGSGASSCTVGGIAVVFCSDCSDSYRGVGGFPPDVGC